MFSLPKYVCEYSLRAYIRHRQFFLTQHRRTTSHPTVGIIIIGDEILKARVKDTNSYYMCSLLYRCGIKVKKISVISDDVVDIAKEIKDFSEMYTYVITSGGIGPTHDDVTYEGLSKAFGDSLHYHPTLVDIIKNYFGYSDISSPAFKMAYIPSKATLKFGIHTGTDKQIPYPCIKLNNVHIFPGSPIYCENLFQSLHKELFSTNKKFVAEEIYVNSREDSFADVLTAVSKEFPHVSFGSYPKNNASHYKALITVESDSVEETRKARDRFCSLVPPNILVDYDCAPHKDSVTKYLKFRKETRQPETFDRTLNYLSDILHKPEEVAIYFDKSVESIIILHLAHVAAARSQLQEKLQIICLRNDNFSGDEAEDTVRRYNYYMEDIIRRYNVNVHTLQGEISQAIRELKSLKPQLRTLLVGVRTREFENLSPNGSIKMLEIRYPLSGWSDDQISTFAKSLCLPHFSG